jgi:hypothetical protein
VLALQPQNEGTRTESTQKQAVRRISESKSPFKIRSCIARQQQFGLSLAHSHAPRRPPALRARPRAPLRHSAVPAWAGRRPPPVPGPSHALHQPVRDNGVVPNGSILTVVTHIRSAYIAPCLLGQREQGGLPGSAGRRGRGTARAAAGAPARRSAHAPPRARVARGSGVLSHTTASPFCLRSAHPAGGPGTAWQGWLVPRYRAPPLPRLYPGGGRVGGERRGGRARAGPVRADSVCGSLTQSARHDVPPAHTPDASARVEVAGGRAVRRRGRRRQPPGAGASARPRESATRAPCASTRARCATLAFVSATRRSARPRARLRAACAPGARRGHVCHRASQGPG